jgi:hypothetical protein
MRVPAFVFFASCLSLSDGFQVSRHLSMLPPRFTKRLFVQTYPNGENVNLNESSLGLPQRTTKRLNSFVKPSNKDSLDKFAQDVAFVIKDLCAGPDPTVPGKNLMNLMKFGYACTRSNASQYNLT